MASSAAVPPLIAGSRHAFRRWVLLAAGAAGVVTLFFFDPAQNGFYPICYLHELTGLSCPGCGATRALHELLHGQFAAAARLNLLFVLCLPQSAWLSVRHGGRWVLGRPSKFSIRPAWIWTFFAAAVVFTILRNLPGFEWLSAGS